MKDINDSALVIISLFVLLPVFISFRQRLGLGKDILLASIRGFLQLLILGFLISYIFSFKNIVVILGYVLLMTLIASLSISKKGNDFRKTFFIVAASIILSVSIALCIWLGFSIVPFDAQHIIPLGGMFSGAAMVSCAIVLETMSKEPGKTTYESRKYAVKIAMVPTIEALKTMGLVQIPGTMTGMILAGADPFTAVKYQIFIVFTLLTASSLSAISLSFFSQKLLFSKQYREIAKEKSSL